MYLVSLCREQCQCLDIQLQVSESRYFIVPGIYQRNPHFVGRHDLIEQLRTKLCATQEGTYRNRVALHGMGGVGKTQVAIEYVFKYKEQYSSVFWISAATPGDFQTGFQQIAKTVNCINVDQNTADEVTTAVLRWLEKQSSWLLVFDNLDDISIVDGYLPAVGGDSCHLLITTRNQDPTGIPAQGLEVKVFELHDAVEFFLLRATGSKQSRLGTRSTAARIVHELGYLALAIEHAAAYIRQSCPDLSKFSTMYSQSRKEFLEHLPKQNYSYPRSVATTFLMSLEKVKEVNPNAAELLTLFAFLNPDGILVEFLYDGHKALHEPLRSLIGNSFAFGKALEKLGEFSLIRQSHDGQTISIHRLVQAAIQEHLDPHGSRLFGEAILDLFILAFPLLEPGEEEKRPVCRRYQSQVDGPLQNLLHLGTEKVAAMSARLSAFLYADGIIAACLPFLSMAVEICTNLFGAEDRRTLISVGYLADVYLFLGRFEEALWLNEQLVESMKTMLGLENPDTLSCMHQLTATYSSLGRLKEAVELSQKVLELRQRILGMDHLDTFLSMNRLVRTYINVGQIDDALELQKRALNGLQKKLGTDHSHTLASMDNLAVIYREVGQIDDAVEMHKMVLNAREKTLGIEHPHTLDSMFNLALAYRNRGEIEQAVDLHKTALNLLQNTLGPEHPQTLANMSNLARAYVKQDHMKEAVELMEKVVEARRGKVLWIHPDTVTSMRSLVEMYRQSSRVEDAFTLCQELLLLCEEVWGERHEHTIDCREDLDLLSSSVVDIPKFQ